MADGLRPIVGYTGSPSAVEMSDLEYQEMIEHTRTLGETPQGSPQAQAPEDIQKMETQLAQAEKAKLELQDLVAKLQLDASKSQRQLREMAMEIEGLARPGDSSENGPSGELQRTNAELKLKIQSVEQQCADHENKIVGDAQKILHLERMLSTMQKQCAEYEERASLLSAKPRGQSSAGSASHDELSAASAPHHNQLNSANSTVPSQRNKASSAVPSAGTKQFGLELASAVADQARRRQTVSESEQSDTQRNNAAEASNVVSSLSFHGLSVIEVHALLEKAFADVERVVDDVRVSINEEQASSLLTSVAEASKCVTMSCLYSRNAADHAERMTAHCSKLSKALQASRLVIIITILFAWQIVGSSVCIGTGI